MLWAQFRNMARVISSFNFVCSLVQLCIIRQCNGVISYFARFVQFWINYSAIWFPKAMNMITANASIFRELAAFDPPGGLFFGLVVVMVGPVLSGSVDAVWLTTGTGFFDGVPVGEPSAGVLLVEPVGVLVEVSVSVLFFVSKAFLHFSRLHVSAGFPPLQFCPAHRHTIALFSSPFAHFSVHFGYLVLSAHSFFVASTPSFIDSPPSLSSTRYRQHTAAAAASHSAPSGLSFVLHDMASQELIKKTGKISRKRFALVISNIWTV